jgi:hypothetical protein
MDTVFEATLLTPMGSPIRSAKAITPVVLVPLERRVHFVRLTVTLWNEECRGGSTIKLTEEQ